MTEELIATGYSYCSTNFNREVHIARRKSGEWPDVFVALCGIEVKADRFANFSDTPVCDECQRLYGAR